jgi:hypothetical protein
METELNQRESAFVLKYEPGDCWYSHDGLSVCSVHFAEDVIDACSLADVDSANEVARGFVGKTFNGKKVALHDFSIYPIKKSVSIDLEHREIIDEHNL